MPMMECLLRKEMQDIAAVTVRYFGGIKLASFINVVEQERGMDDGT